MFVCKFSHLLSRYAICLSGLVALYHHHVGVPVSRQEATLVSCSILYHRTAEKGVFVHYASKGRLSACSRRTASWPDQITGIGANILMPLLSNHQVLLVLTGSRIVYTSLFGWGKCRRDFTSTAMCGVVRGGATVALGCEVFLDYDVSFTCRFVSDSKMKEDLVCDMVVAQGCCITPVIPSVHDSCQPRQGKASTNIKHQV